MLECLRAIVQKTMLKRRKMMMFKIFESNKGYLKLVKQSHHLSQGIYSVSFHPAFLPLRIVTKQIDLVFLVVLNIVIGLLQSRIECTAVTEHLINSWIIISFYFSFSLLLSSLVSW